MLKLIRVSRLSRIILKLNIKEDTKLTMKLVNLVFYILLYLHVLGCIWWVVVKRQEQWVPQLYFVDPTLDIYEDNIMRQYMIVLYHAILMLTGNDIIPIGSLEIAFVSFSVTLGAIINANIFGNLALIIQQMNKRGQLF